jgi:hypothetical protein
LELSKAGKKLQLERKALSATHDQSEIVIYSAGTDSKGYALVEEKT